MSQLAFDFDLETTEWAPIYKPFDGTLVDYLGDDLCRDCGAKTAYNQGGAGRSGIYTICDGCAQLDSCRVREHNPVVERRPGRSGITTEEAAHCENCGWWLSVERWDDEGVWRELTADEVQELCAEHATPWPLVRSGAPHI